jgi:protein involved in polysaccharide export with SLBB domain
MRYYYFVSFLVVASLMSSCGFYRRDILFKASKEKEAEFAAISKQVKTPKNYLVQRNDYLEFQIFTNKGENVIDPTSEYQKQMSSAGATSQSSLVRYLIQADGCADLPIIGHTKLDSLTLHQVDSLLSKEYGKYYQDVSDMFTSSAMVPDRPSGEVELLPEVGPQTPWN